MNIAPQALSSELLRGLGTKVNSRQLTQTHTQLISTKKVIERKVLLVVLRSLGALRLPSISTSKYTFTKEFRTVVPAMVNDIITIKLVKKAKTQKTM